MAYEYLFKCIIVGDKAKLIYTFAVDKRLMKVPDVAIGGEFGALFVTIGSKQIKMMIRDTAGGIVEGESVSSTHYRSVCVVFLLYDITRRETYNKLSTCLEIARSENSNVSIVLIGNKSDLLDREVTKEEGLRFASEHNLIFFELSALTASYVMEAFTFTAEIVYDNVKQGILNLDQDCGVVSFKGFNVEAAEFSPLPKCDSSLDGNEDVTMNVEGPWSTNVIKKRSTLYKTFQRIINNFRDTKILNEALKTVIASGTSVAAPLMADVLNGANLKEENAVLRKALDELEKKNYEL